MRLEGFLQGLLVVEAGVTVLAIGERVEVSALVDDCGFAWIASSGEVFVLTESLKVARNGFIPKSGHTTIFRT